MAQLVGDGVMGNLTPIRVTMSGGQQMWAFKNDKDQTLYLVSEPPFEWDECIKAAPPGLIMEFGVRGGNTIREISKEAKKFNRLVYGFDWWKGLPHEWDEHSPKGACLAEKPQDLPDNCELIEGLFSDTLEDFLKVHHDPVGFINLDCDLYCSTLYVLHCLMGRFVKGSMVALSAMTCFPTLAQKEAWKRYLKESGQKWEFKGKQHHWGEVYELLSK